MNYYDINDFVQYYQRSWWLNPYSGEIVKIAGVDPANNQNVIAVGIVSGETKSIPLRDIDWKHVSTPTLGYRGTKDGLNLYYLSRKSGRRAAKGVTPEAIIVQVPTVMASLAKILGKKHVNFRGFAGGDTKLIHELFNPTFIRLSDAITKLKQNKNALGFPVSYYWAVTIGEYKERPFLLHFKNTVVAHSLDGYNWTFYDTKSQSLFKAGEIS